MVPLALGSQTTGSTIRPASYCGVVGLKPTHGLIPRSGMFQLSRALDHVGLFARSVDDVALLLETLAGHDERDPDSRPRAHLPYRAIAAQEPPRPARFGFAKTVHWKDVDADAQKALIGFVGSLGDRVDEIALPAQSCRRPGRSVSAGSGSASIRTAARHRAPASAAAEKTKSL